MNKKSLTEARQAILESLSRADIDLVDKMELMINLNNLLDEDHYKEDIKVLKINEIERNRRKL